MFKSIFYFRFLDIMINLYNMFQGIIGTIYWKYILLSTTMSIYKDSMISYVTNTKQVNVVKNGQKRDITYKYYIFHFLTYLRSFFDEQVDCLHVH